MKIVLLGSGNVANHLGKILYNSGQNIIEVYNKFDESGILLAKKLNAEFINKVEKINKNADLYIISVVDDFLDELVSKLEINSGMIVHTSGTKNIDCLSKFKNYGVLYPLQTFSKDTELKYKEIPFLLEANTPENLIFLNEFTSEFYDNIYHISSEKRKQIHTAAVFACNFTNYMFSISEDILNKNDISFDILKPLIQETVNKVINNSPKQSQTGPAKRKDIKLINEHLKLLKLDKDYQKIYGLLSDSIINDFN